MGLVTRAGLAAENRLGLWCSALTYSPRVPEPWKPSRAVPGGSGTAMGLLRSEWSVQWRQLAVLSL